MERADAIRMTGICKAFPGILANDGIDLNVRQGEIHALLGENGAGKSTLMSVLFGLYAPDAGTIEVRGREARIRGPGDAAALGIGMVHQHFKLVRNFSVAENIVLGLEPRNRLGNTDLALAGRRVAELSAAYRLDIDPTAKIENITVGMQQRVEILKILYRDADILIFDEPTAMLTPQETDELLAIFRRLKSEGKTLLFITHKLKEIKAVADRCTVLRGGRQLGTFEVAETSEAELAERMVGRAVSFRMEKKKAVPGPVVLEIENLRVAGSRGTEAVGGLSLKLHAGEVLGIAGVDGNGQSELVAAIAGLLPVRSGRILLEGRDVSRDGIRRRTEAGQALVPEDRQRHGLIGEFRIDENLILRKFRRKPFSNRFGFLDFKAIGEHAGRLIEDFDIRCARGPATPVRSMSGGNQQKVVIARELDLQPRLLVVSQPTRGLDVGAIQYIHRRIVGARDSGCAVLLVSFELEEVLNLCDRIAVISGGRILGEMPAAGADERRIGAMMGGMHADKIA
ncbi:MAG: ABC transporter ATP-binding protein [Treponema sp.]|nr:ABC transporter ATP-binding protein [Treponema sp.]